MFSSTKIIELGSCAFRQPEAESHCRFLHGYRLTAKFWFEANNLDQNNWVVDFGGLKGLKELLKNQFDHTTCISRTDPKLDVFKKLKEAGVCDLRIMDGVGIEKFAEYCHTVAEAYVDELTDSRCRCVKVEVFEHESNSAIFEKRHTISSGATYMNDRADEIEKPSKAFTEKKETMDRVEKNTKSDVTLPPFAKNKPAPIIQKKTKGWLDPNSTNSWGV